MSDLDDGSDDSSSSSSSSDSEDDVPKKGKGKEKKAAPKRLVKKPGREWLHWLVTNVPGSALQSGETVAAYIGYFDLRQYIAETSEPFVMPLESAFQ